MAAQPNDHIVSKGWQRNFANDRQRVAVADVSTCQIVDRARPIKRNFAEPWFMTHTDSSGATLRDADDVFQKIERRVLNKVREINVTCRLTDDHREAVVQLFTIHLVRSQGFRDSQFALLDQLEPQVLRDYPTDPRVYDAFMRRFDRPPLPGEVEANIARWMAAQRAGDVVFDNIDHSIQTIGNVLRRWHVQVIESEPSHPGFVLGDVPVIHSRLTTRQFGFRDGLAVGDADIIMAPISRRVMVCFAVEPREAMTLSTKRSVRTINALTIHGARQEVACHPDDGADLQRACRSVDDDLPQGPELIVRARPR